MNSHLSKPWLCAQNELKWLQITYAHTERERGRRKAVNGCMYLLFNTLSPCVLILIMNLDAIYQITQRVNYFVVNRNSYWGNRSEVRALTSLSVCVFCHIWSFFWAVHSDVIAICCLLPAAAADDDDDRLSNATTKINFNAWMCARLLKRTT